MTWRTIRHGAAVIIVSVAMMAGPADGAPWPDDDGPSVAGSMADVFCPVHPADECAEDESWTAVDYRSPDGVEDVHGVTRACRHDDDGR